MQNIRTLAIINSLGVRLPLNVDNIFAYNPDGLGVSFSNNYLKTGNNNIELSSFLNQNIISFNLLFGVKGGKPYDSFNKFISYLDYQPLKLEYGTTAGTYIRDIKLLELPKTEIKEYNIIDQKISFECLGLWYKYRTIKRNKYIDQPNDGKIYENQNLGNNEGFYIYDYIYEESNKTNNIYSISNNSIYLNSKENSPTKITFFGAVENPEIKLLQNGKEIFTDKYFITVQDKYKLIVDSTPENQKVELLAPDETTSNAYQTQDITKTNFIKIPSGKSTIITNADNIEIQIKEEFVVV